MRPVFRRFRTNRPALVSMAGLGTLVAFCILAPILSSHDPYALDFTQQKHGPSGEHWLGTDFFGRDVLVRLALGGRASMLIAVAALAVAAVIGVLYGSIAGLVGGRIDNVMMRVLDGAFALPRFAILVSLVAVLGRHGSTYSTLVFGLAIVSWMTTARLVRGEVVRLKQTEYVNAARSLGAKRLHLLRKHIGPSTFGIVTIAVFLELPGLVLTEALVSALGLGPSAATWGNIAWLGIQEGQLSHVVYVSMGLAIFAICANFIADGLQEALDPRAEQAIPESRRGLLA
ncbi:MAG TPA: ABC transporter permease [Gaiellaceae bacterium]|nr:ABC transporter permease [Gaiellaceae bacterium]